MPHCNGALFIRNSLLAYKLGTDKAILQTVAASVDDAIDCCRMNTHTIDEKGEARMVDVGDKASTQRRARPRRDPLSLMRSRPSFLETLRETLWLPHACRYHGCEEDIRTDPIVPSNRTEFSDREPVT